MAQSFEEIIEDMNQAQAEYPELNDLSSPSSVSVWGHIKKMFALLSLTLQKGFDSFRAEIDAKIISQQIGTLPWYVDTVKKFQYGDQLNVEDNNVGYGVLDPEKQIIAQASATEVTTGGYTELLIKAVKSSEAGDLEPLSINEKDALEEYISKIKFAGVKTSLVSAVADVIRLEMTVELNLLMVNSDGSKIGEATSFPVQEAIEEYFKKLPFDGVLYWTKLIDHLQLMPEVKDAVITASWSVLGVTAIPFSRLYRSYSGHLILDENSTINYVV